MNLEELFSDYEYSSESRANRSERMKNILKQLDGLSIFDAERLLDWCKGKVRSCEIKWD